MALEGLEDSVSHSCLWNSKGVLGRLNRRGVGDGEFRHGLGLLDRALDEFAMAHCVVGFEQEDAPSVQILSVNFLHSTGIEPVPPPWILGSRRHSTIELKVCVKSGIRTHADFSIPS